jgi:hypothetical protein
MQLNDRVVVDNDGASHYDDPEKAKQIQMPNFKDLLAPMMGVMQMFDRKEPPIKPGDFDERNANLDDVHVDADFTPLQARLCPSSANCFSLTSRKWFAISIENLSEVEWNMSAWDHLVLDESTKNTIKMLVEHHRARANEEVIGDVIEGKGNVS